MQVADLVRLGIAQQTQTEVPSKGARMIIDLDNIETVNLSQPAVGGLFVNTFYESAGQYELWLDTPDITFRADWVKCSVNPSRGFLEKWLTKLGIKYA